MRTKPPRRRLDLAGQLFGRGALPRWTLSTLLSIYPQALGILDSSSSAFRKCLRELRSICGTRGIVPTSYTIPSHLLHISTNPYSSGSYGDVYRGTFDGAKVCAKRVRVYTREGLQMVTKVCWRLSRYVVFAGANENYRPSVERPRR
jgi:hypothetical protein